MVVAGFDLSVAKGIEIGLLEALPGDGPHGLTVVEWEQVSVAVPQPTAAQCKEQSLLTRDCHRIALSATLTLDALEQARSDGWTLDYAYVEQPRGRFNVRVLNGIYGAVVAAIAVAYSADHVEHIEPLSWREVLGLPGERNKELMVTMAGELFPGFDGNDDQAESLLITLACAGDGLES